MQGSLPYTSSLRLLERPLAALVSFLFWLRTSDRA